MEKSPSVDKSAQNNSGDGPHSKKLRSASTTIKREADQGSREFRTLWSSQQPQNSRKETSNKIYVETEAKISQHNLKTKEKVFYFA
jgi:hypothetical protein